MSNSAKISSIDVVTDFRVALIRFSEDVSTTLTSLQMEVQRSQEWIKHDRPTYWKRMQRKQFDVVATARQELSACKRRGVGDKKPACIEEEQRLKKAKRRLQEIEEVINSLPRWKTKMNRGADEYKARVGSLQRFVDNDLQRAILLLERMTTILDEYTETAAPAEVESTGSTTQSSVTQPVTASQAVVAKATEPPSSADEINNTDQTNNTEELEKKEST